MVSVDSVDSVDTVSWSLSIICVIICVDWNIKRYVSLYYLDNDHILTLTLIRFSGKQREDQRNKSRVNLTKLWQDKWGLGNRVSAQSEGLQERPSSSSSKVIIENIDMYCTLYLVFVEVVGEDISYSMLNSADSKGEGATSSTKHGVSHQPESFQFKEWDLLQAEVGSRWP